MNYNCEYFVGILADLPNLMNSSCLIIYFWLTINSSISFSAKKDINLTDKKTDNK